MGNRNTVELLFGHNLLPSLLYDDSLTQVITAFSTIANCQRFLRAYSIYIFFIELFFFCFWYISKSYKAAIYVMPQNKYLYLYFN